MPDKHGNVPYPDGPHENPQKDFESKYKKFIMTNHSSDNATVAISISDSKITTESDMTTVGMHVSNLSDVVHLKDATVLLGKVFGTDPGSVYRVVALGPMFNVAARLNGTTMSIRAEGSPAHMLSHKSYFHETGFEEKSQEHTSMHLYNVVGARASKCLGAAIAGCHGNFDVVCLDANKVKTS